MKIQKIWNDSPSERQIAETARDLGMGALAIIPTDTLYGIVCDALDPKAIEKLCRLKGVKPDKNTLSIICKDISMAAEYAKIDNKAYEIIKRYTPGPYTFILPVTRNLPKAFKGRKVVGIRIPDNQTARLLAEALDHPMLTTSVSYEEEDFAINPDLIAEAYYDQVEIMIQDADGDMTPSTVVDLTGPDPEVIREGKGEF